MKKKVNDKVKKKMCVNPALSALSKEIDKCAQGFMKKYAHKVIILDKVRTGTTFDGKTEVDLEFYIHRNFRKELAEDCKKVLVRHGFKDGLDKLHLWG